ncbi:phosphatidylinositol-3,5-bisphosphate 3-phosphatase MTMR8 isoform X4 [Engystomops pustulosus]|uniref:phosphatidylinositol-3,5-bisphosphate 3-phosphatase MTMR8 isoform X4 n=1 Tax=Engystomops pustulosus TaxID=76066 RepID=UPI003AFAB76B
MMEERRLQYIIRSYLRWEPTHHIVRKVSWYNSTVQKIPSHFMITTAWDLHVAMLGDLQYEDPLIDPRNDEEQVENVKLLDRFTNKRPANGSLYLTATHLIYVDAAAGVRKETWIAHHHIASVEKLPISTTGCPLIIHCKNFRVAHFVIPRERDCHEVYTSLLKLSQPVKYEDLYAFFYYPKSDQDERLMEWKLIDLKMEYMRMGIPNKHWVLSDINKDFKVCSTYPTSLVVPKEASESTIIGSSKFRSRERFPVLSYYYKDNNAVICRCSQPLSGFSTRCEEDEKMLEIISRANPGSPFMYVVDTRPKLNAMANRAAGKGYENEDNYPNIHFQFIGIENIHVMRGSLQKLLEVCELKSPSMSNFLTVLENSGWLRHIKAIMDASVFLAKFSSCSWQAVRDDNTSVLVHCSDGWDRTAQVCSLASILLDPFYRTIKGFMVLIEKEWISLGHKFSQRCHHLEFDPKEVSPVFTQFLECIWHLTEQFPCAFEFSEKYLLEIHDHVFSCQFGNFIGNSQKERQELKFWCGMYNRFDKGMHPRQSVLDHLLECMNSKASLKTSETDMEDKLVKQNAPPADSCTLTKDYEDVPEMAELCEMHSEGEGPAHLSNGSVANSDVCIKREIKEEPHGASILHRDRDSSDSKVLPSTDNSGNGDIIAPQ